MQIKAQTVIPPHVKITRCPPREGKGKSIWTLLRQDEQQAERAEKIAREQERFKEALAKGMSVAAAAQYAMQ